jgi:hypothetical protein
MKTYVAPKRWLVAGVAALTLAGGAYAFAASLTVVSNPLGAGSSTVSAPPCDSTVSYTTAWSTTTTPPDFVVDSVTVTAVPNPVGGNGCAGMHVQVALTGTISPPFPVALPTMVLSVANPATATWSGLGPLGIPVADVTDVHVAITP